MARFFSAAAAVVLLLVAAWIVHDTDPDDPLPGADVLSSTSAAPSSHMSPSTVLAPAQPVTVTAARLTASDVARAARCSDFTPSEGRTESFDQSGTCTLAGHPIEVYVFGSDDSRDAWLRSARAPGHAIGRGAHWLITGADSAAVVSATEAAGGQVVGS
jgi:hypothetical protein